MRNTISKIKRNAPAVEAMPTNNVEDETDVPGISVEVLNDVHDSVTCSPLGGIVLRSDIGLLPRTVLIVSLLLIRQAW